MMEAQERLGSGGRGLVRRWRSRGAAASSRVSHSHGASHASTRALFLLHRETLQLRVAFDLHSATMPSVPLHPPSAASETASGLENPLPQLLQTPSGLAMLEIQGTIHSSATQPEPDAPSASDAHMAVGRLVFPNYSPSDPPENKAWMKRVHMYVGKHQRMTGEVKELPKPVAVIQRKPGTSEEDGQEELEIVDIIRHKIIFSSRPEPVSAS